MKSQVDRVLSAVAVGDLVYASGPSLREGVYSMSCRAAYGPILIGVELVMPAWCEVKLLPPF